MVPVSVRYWFYQPMDKKVKTWPLPFPAKENPNMEKALFDWPIVLRAFVSIRLTNQIALFPYVCCFCFVREFSFQGHTKMALFRTKKRAISDSVSFSYNLQCAHQE